MVLRGIEGTAVIGRRETSSVSSPSRSSRRAKPFSIAGFRGRIQAKSTISPGREFSPGLALLHAHDRTRRGLARIRAVAG
jgi:hypothetical protein